MTETPEMEAIAKAIAEANLWPGAWDKMPDAERNYHRAAAEAVLRARQPTAEIARLREALQRIAEEEGRSISPAGKAMNCFSYARQALAAVSGE